MVPKIKRASRPAEERFWEKVDNRGPSECWRWSAGVGSHGYGVSCHNGEGCPPGHCEHRLCCNPAHLEAVSNQENVNRSHNSNIRKTRCPKGHVYSPENTRLQIRGKSKSRKCITCERQRDAMRPSRKAA